MITQGVAASHTEWPRTQWHRRELARFWMNPALLADGHTTLVTNASHLTTTGARDSLAQSVRRNSTPSV